MKKKENTHGLASDSPNENIGEPAENLHFSVDGIPGAGAETSPCLLIDAGENVVFPYNMQAVTLSGEAETAAAEAAVSGPRLLALFYTTPSTDELRKVPPHLHPGARFTAAGKTYSSFGILVRIVRRLEFPDGGVKILVRGLKRIKAVRVFDKDGIPCAQYKTVSGEITSENEKLCGAACSSAVKEFRKLAERVGSIPDDVQMGINSAPDAGRAADLLAGVLNTSYAEKLAMLYTADPGSRIVFALSLAQRERELVELGLDLEKKVHQGINRQQRDMFLQEQLRVIQEELGEDSRTPDIIDLDKRIKAAGLPEEAAGAVAREFGRLVQIPPSAPEYHIAYSYIGWLVDFPWKKSSADVFDCRAAEKILERDHYGLADVKKRILEFIAVLQLKKEQDRRAPILCLVGPPGVGKTSLGKSIAAAVGRKFIRMSLGGMRDEAEIRGHRRTYVGAMPGRIVQNIRKAGVNNPVFMLDEIDKLAHDFRGDPASALLEVLDPEQNSAFNDNYIEIDVDLSRVFFIATANTVDDIPAPLRDRMEIIEIPGYTPFEKREIARRYLIPRQKTENGLPDLSLKFTAKSVDYVIDRYTREAGVRQLERTFATVMRRLACRITAGKLTPSGELKADTALIRDLLGAAKYNPDDTGLGDMPGCAMGMAWTSCGGVTLPVEAVSLPGKGELKLTGSLGKVMQESAAAALSLVRAHAGEFGIGCEFFSGRDFHIHVPDGATPKDGPSAGITMTVALMSHILDRPPVPRLAMTGEINLRGQVTAIGGVREKVTAALRNGMTDIMLPLSNMRDVDELPENVRGKLRFHPVGGFREALECAFGLPLKRLREAASPAGSGR